MVTQLTQMLIIMVLVMKFGEQTEGKITHLVAGVLVVPSLRYFQILERKNSKIHVTGADPKGSILAEPESLNNSTEGYLVEGIGYDFIPDVLNRKYVDDWIKTDDAESLNWLEELLEKKVFWLVVLLVLPYKLLYK